MNLTTITLGELMSFKDETVKRNAISIFKRLPQAIAALAAANGERLAGDAGPCKVCDVLGATYCDSRQHSMTQCIYNHDHTENLGAECEFHD